MTNAQQLVIGVPHRDGFFHSSRFFINTQIANIDLTTFHLTQGVAQSLCDI